MWWLCSAADGALTAEKHAHQMEKHANESLRRENETLKAEAAQLREALAAATAAGGEAAKECGALAEQKDALETQLQTALAVFERTNQELTTEVDAYMRSLRGGGGGDRSTCGTPRTPTSGAQLSFESFNDCPAGHTPRWPSTDGTPLGAGKALRARVAELEAAATASRETEKGLRVAASCGEAEAAAAEAALAAKTAEASELAAACHVLEAQNEELRAAAADLQHTADALRRKAARLQAKLEDERAAAGAIEERSARLADDLAALRADNARLAKSGGAEVRYEMLRLTESLAAFESESEHHVAALSARNAALAAELSKARKQLQLHQAAAPPRPPEGRLSVP